MSTENTKPHDRPDEPSYRKILVPTDGSDESRLAMDNAVALARAFSGEIHALSVEESAGSPQRDHLRTDSEEIAEEAIAESAGEAERKEIPVTHVVRDGGTEEAILKYVRDADIDIIVMGTEGRTGITGAIFASVAEKIVRDAPVPVLTVRPDNVE